MFMGRRLHLGFPEQIGIEDLDKPDYGSASEVGPDEMPVFWACGVTPQAIVENAKPSLCITHKPCAMLLTDKLNAKLAMA